MNLNAKSEFPRLTPVALREIGADPRDGALKKYRVGTDRTTDPGSTVDRVWEHHDRLGVTRLANVTGLDAVGLPVVMCVRPNSRALAVSQGKGLTLDAARASALMESVESFCAERIAAPLFYATSTEAGDIGHVANLDRLPRRSNAILPHNRPILWIEGFDIVADRRTLVPFELVHSNYTLPLPPGSGFFPLTSNGLAAGNHALEALSCAMSELIERDAATIWQTMGGHAIDQLRVDLETVDDEGCLQVLELLDGAELDVAAWEITSDIHVPTFGAMIVDRDTGSLRRLYPCGGMGCHPRRAVALARALTEAIQSRLTFISGARDDMSRTDYKFGRNPDLLSRQATLVRQGGGDVDFTAAPDFDSPSHAEDVEFQLSRLGEVGIDQVIVCNVSDPAIPASVVRVVIPGLESFGTASGFLLGKRAGAALQAVSQGDGTLGDEESASDGASRP